jgi:hypothetical protein
MPTKAFKTMSGNRRGHTGRRRRRGGVTRMRVPRPAGFDRMKWDDAVHEGGHALMTFCLWESVLHVYLPDSITELPYTRSGRRRLSEGGLALVKVAGAAAERSRGKRSARMSSGDRAGLDDVTVWDRRTIEALAEDFFRLSEVAPLLDRCARFLYERWGTGVVPGADILAAIREKQDSSGRAVDVAAESLLNEVDSLLEFAFATRRIQASLLDRLAG